MKLVLLVGTGSFIGGAVRYLLNIFFDGKITFPYGTFCINILGCFLIGIVFAFAAKSSISNETKLFLTTGIIGGFTTFSAFSNEIFILLKNSQFPAAFTYAGLSVFIGVLATIIGYWVVNSH